jgi:hypothetical protein
MKVGDKVKLTEGFSAHGVQFKAGSCGQITQVGTEDFPFAKVEFEGHPGSFPTPKSILVIVSSTPATNSARR